MANENKRSGARRTATRVAPERSDEAHITPVACLLRLILCGQSHCEKCFLCLSVSERKQRRHTHRRCPTLTARQYNRVLVIRRYLKQQLLRQIEDELAALDPKLTRTAAAAAAAKLGLKSRTPATPLSPPQRAARKRSGRRDAAAAAPAPTSAASASKPVRAHARRGQRSHFAVPSSFASVNGLSPSFIPLAFTDHQRTTLRQLHDYSFASSRRWMETLCRRWKAKHLEWDAGPLTKWRFLHNVDKEVKPKTWQFDALQEYPQLSRETEAAVRAALPAIPRGYVLQACKMLASEVGAVAQERHTDLQEQHELHHKAISVLLHLHPTQTAWVQKDLRLTGKHLQYCPEDAYHCYTADLGTLFAFRTDVLHYGPANPSPTDQRVLVYLLFVPQLMDDDTGENQTFFCRSLASTVPDH